MDNKELINNIKFSLAMELTKQGSSLAEFDSLLATDKDAAIEKLAFSLSDISGTTKDGVQAIGSLSQYALALSLLGGVLTGGGLYGIGKVMENQDSRLASKKEEIGRLKDMTGKIKTDYNV